MQPFEVQVPETLPGADQDFEFLRTQGQEDGLERLDHLGRKTGPSHPEIWVTVEIEQRNQFLAQFILNRSEPRDTGVEFTCQDRSDHLAVARELCSWIKILLTNVFQVNGLTIKDRIAAEVSAVDLSVHEVEFRPKAQRRGGV